MPAFADEASTEGEAFLPLPFAAGITPAWLNPLGVSCVCPLPGPCLCNASLE